MNTKESCKYDQAFFIKKISLFIFIFYRMKNKWSIINYVHKKIRIVNHIHVTTIFIDILGKNAVCKLNFDIFKKI